MTTRIRIGATVQTTSMAVLWVVAEGLGLALALKRTTTMTSKASTSATMPMQVQSRMPSWKVWMESISGVTEGCRPIWPGTG